MKNKYSLSILALALVALCASCSALQAGVVAREALPVSDINTGSVANWSLDNHLYSPAYPAWITVGDTINVTGDYTATNMTVWAVGNEPLESATGGAATFDWTSLALYFGTPDSLSLASTATTGTRVFYANGENYLASAGSYRALWQIDFAITRYVTTGAYAFTVYNNPMDNPFHISATLAGFSPDGGDGTYYQFYPDSVTTYSSAGWPGYSGVDINFQLDGTPGVPEPSTWILAGFGIAAVLLGRRRLAA